MAKNKNSGKKVRPHRLMLTEERLREVLEETFEKFLGRSRIDPSAIVARSEKGGSREEEAT
jgi:hypothetical protein